MKLKLFILFILVFGAIGQTIFLNIDAKSNFLEEKSKNNYALSSTTELDKSSVESSEVVVTIRQHETENLNQDFDANSETEQNDISTLLEAKKTCVPKTEEERLICQKAKEAAKQKQNRISGSNHTKNSSIQTP